MLDTLTFLLANLRLSSLLPSPFTGASDREEEEEEEEEVLVLPRAPAPPPVRFERGDLLEVPRTLFTHFGIYLGQGRVAHLIPDFLPVLTSDPRRIRVMVTNTRLVLGVLSKRASVRVDSVEDFAYGSGIRLNGMDLVPDWVPVPGEDSARRAERSLGPVAYSLLWNNCEHFVTHCRYGHAHSLQTQQFCARLQSLIQEPRVAMVTALLGLALLLGLGTAAPPTLLLVLLLLLLPFTLWMAS